MSSLRSDNDMAGTVVKDEPNREPTYERRDTRRRDLIDHAIAVQQSCNTMSAVELLKSHDIAAAVIERVMLDPQRRRRDGAQQGTCKK